MASDSYFSAVPEALWKSQANSVCLYECGGAGRAPDHVLLQELEPPRLREKRFRSLDVQ
jgi:hypothetical protein